MTHIQFCWKRVRQTEPTQEGDPGNSRPAKARRPLTPSLPTSATATDPGTPARSRWGRWQVHLSSPESPEDPQQTRRRREREKQGQEQKATGPSGLKGPSIQGLSGKIATSQPLQGREGTGVEGSTSIGTPGPRNLPPDLRHNQGNLPWELRPRKKSRKGPICDQMYK